MLAAELARALFEQGEVDLFRQRRELVQFDLLRFQFPEQRLRQRENGVGQRVGIDARRFPAQEVLRPVKAQAGRLGGTRRHGVQKRNKCNVVKGVVAPSLAWLSCTQGSGELRAASLPLRVSDYCAGRYNR